MTDTAIVNWENEVKHCQYDEKVGIRIAKLTGNSYFSTYITYIDQNRHVNPHYHKVGDEHYHIINGNGLVKLKDMSTGNEQSIRVNAGESFIVPANTMHQLINEGSSSLVLMFSCPETHLESDRFFT